MKNPVLRSHCVIGFALLLSWFPAATTALVQPKIAPKVQSIIDAWEQALPEYEQAADQHDEALQPLVGSADP